MLGLPIDHQRGAEIAREGAMAAKRALFITNERVAEPADVPDVIADQAREADAVCVVAPTPTSRLHSWLSDIDAEYREADERMRMLVGDIDSSGPAVCGRVGDEDPLQAVACADSGAP
jgi:hypothetical protein